MATKYTHLSDQELSSTLEMAQVQELSTGAVLDQELVREVLDRFVLEQHLDNAGDTDESHRTD